MKKHIFGFHSDENKKNVRHRILDVAARLFYNQGTKHTGINQIIAESKVAKASFYQYFPSKEDLIIECLDIYNDTITRVIRRLIDRSRSMHHFFKRWTRLIMRNVQRETVFNGCPIANIGFQMEPDNIRLKEKFREITGGWQSIMTGLFEKARRTGEIAGDIESDTLFREIVRINEGAFIMWRLTGDIHYIEGMLDSFMRLLG
ncbi:MAG: TetR/AcrR family transcriptional regulator [Spirochaetales bacterium]|nr:TetR/AcrR family transcriptional regulator [Spirochaetales bacterium]